MLVDDGKQVDNTTFRQFNSIAIPVRRVKDGIRKFVAHGTTKLLGHCQEEARWAMQLCMPIPTAVHAGSCTFVRRVVN
jgi:hypothetical protein